VVLASVLASRIRRHRPVILCGLSLLIVYAASYIHLSRRGMAEATETGTYRYYFSSPFRGGSEQTHMFLYRLYRPAIYLDRMLGNKAEPGSWPLAMKE
jgi:hypothetical protein